MFRLNDILVSRFTALNVCQVVSNELSGNDRLEVG